ncbi:MAG TPA: hypothetical protein PLI30_09665 [Petrimonas sp.]|nr:hypothetical protein [Petrimonas sp.]
MKYGYYVILLALAISIAGCATKKSILTSVPQNSNIRLDGKPITIEITDLRNKTTQKQLRIPTITLPGQKDKVHPALTDYQRKLINEQILLHFNQSDPELKVKCTILEGFQAFTAYAFHEREYVQVDIKIELLDPESNILEYGTSTAFFEVKSLDASNEFINELYHKAIRTAIHDCLIKLAD